MKMAKKMIKKMTINIQCRPVLMTALAMLTSVAVSTATATANAAAGVDANVEANMAANMENSAAPLGVTQNLKSGQRSPSEKLAKIVERYYQDGLNLNPLEGTAQTGDLIVRRLVGIIFRHRRPRIGCIDWDRR